MRRSPISTRSGSRPEEGSSSDPVPARPPYKSKVLPPLRRKQSPVPSALVTAEERLLLRIAASSLDQELPLQDLLHVCVLEGELQQFSQYTQTTGWLIDRAADMFGSEGHLMTYTTGDYAYHLTKERDDRWRIVDPSERLDGRIYEFVAPTKAHLIKWCARTMASATTVGHEGNSSTMARLCYERNRSCLIAGPIPKAFTIASHLVPKRLGDEQVVSLLQQLSGLGVAGKYDPRTSVTLHKLFDVHVDTFTMGFLPQDEERLLVHEFGEVRRNGESLDADGNALKPDALPVHGQTIIIPRLGHPRAIPYPPMEVFQWHYLQCVIREFGHNQYKTLGTQYSVMESPARSPDSGGLGEGPLPPEENPYPSYNFDRFMTHVNLKKDINNWRSTIPPTSV